MENTLKDLIERENFIIKSLMVENNACKGCKESAIQYHKDLRFVLKAFCDLCYYTEGDYGLDIYLGTGEELDLIKETASKIKGTGKSADALNKLLEELEK